MQPEIKPHLLLKITKPGISNAISVVYTENKNMFIFKYVFIFLHVCICTCM